MCFTRVPPAAGPARQTRPADAAGTAAAYDAPAPPCRANGCAAGVPGPGRKAAPALQRTRPKTARPTAEAESNRRKSAGDWAAPARTARPDPTSFGAAVILPAGPTPYASTGRKGPNPAAAPPPWAAGKAAGAAAATAAGRPPADAGSQTGWDIAGRSARWQCG